MHDVIEKIKDDLEESVYKVFEHGLIKKIENMVSKLSLCESPIEKMMLISLESILPDYCVISPQVKVSNYRVDFMVKIFEPFGYDELLTLVIECDGHEYHEKTKKQAKRDKKRDRELQRNNVDTILRYTGSEIYNDSFECAEDVYGVIVNKLER